ncbi:MAG: Stk1 family PASTA domain-containing Ser/Thr kinase [Ruminococcus sp.]|uniref:non-specific serine/threonine protein kinase n=1 Tax=Schaedlerella arabinosiphila TaxID=2044587 RepID=A0A426DDF5_9FIRM|nr:Stk1 family PASTA domain-containing Ser/Thr kinase [Schaedlerella arabinosiphila]MCI8722123.1 Stk1 family PASTA domain-containing Ser/Thr kinase [Ruminococcus sp.]RRK30877.1 Stk1 family PASTA domain-containing Ser/Thr kinase [Schaedlerella arabinosiphila]
MLKEGIFLGKRYEILERVGSGGMADVYKGKDHKLNRYVAVKVLKSDYRSDEIFIQKFLSEAQAAAGLMHPNVVNVYDVGQDRGLYYMVMELVEGITLKDYIEKKGQLSANETISISIQMATGIQAAHDQHIIHRDIKPQNIIISIDGKVKVTDFGIARATTSTQTISTNVMGSVHYTSPEHAKGGNVDEKSDIYSAGITMYEMITGHVPFDGDSTVSVAIKHLQEEIPSPVKEVPEIPYSLECIILKCTQKNAERRYQNCQELIMDLKRSLVDPEGDFVNNPEYIPGGDETIMMSDEDKRRIQNRNNYQQDYYEEEEDYGGGYGDDGYGDDEYDDYEDDYERSRGNGDGSGSVVGTVLKVVVTLAIIVIAAVIIFMVVKSEGFFDKMSIDSPIKEEEETKQVSVPYLIGLTEDEAKDALSKEGLGYGVSERVQSDEFERGQIISQSPEADQKVDVNTEILVSVSIGKAIEKKKVPEVAGQDEAAAKNMMANSGFVVEVEQREDDNVPAGKVITTAPAGGVEVVEGTKIILYVSKGSNKVTVPSLKDMTKEQAANLLASMELTGSVSGEEFSDDVEEGKIISQSPAAGEKVPKNTPITYVVSKGKEDKDDDKDKDPDRPGYPGSSGGDMPNVKGMEAGYAISILDSYGYPASIIDYETNSTMISGYVISQTLYDDGTVGLVVSQN